MSDETITLNTGRIVGIGMIPTPRNLLASARPMRASMEAAPVQCCNSNGCKWHWDGNNYTGTCVTAFLANWLSAVSPCDISDANALAWARRNGGMNGMNIPDALSILQRDPMTDAANVKHTIGPHVSVNWEDAAAVYEAVATYRGLDLGVDHRMLQSAATDQSGWVLSGVTRQYTNYDHSVGILDYGPASFLKGQYEKFYGVKVDLGTLAADAPAVGLYTWDTIGIIELASFQNITGEAWAIESINPPWAAPVDPNQPPAPVPDPNFQPTPVDPPAPPPVPVPPKPRPTRRAAEALLRGHDLHAAGHGLFVDGLIDYVHRQLDDYELRLSRK